MIVPLWHIVACAIALAALVGLTVYAALGIRAQNRENRPGPRHRRNRR